MRFCSGQAQWRFCQRTPVLAMGKPTARERQDVRHCAPAPCALFARRKNTDNGLPSCHALFPVVGTLRLRVEDVNRNIAVNLMLMRT